MARVVTHEKPVPTMLVELPEHTRKWLDSMTPERIARYEKWEAFITWAETTGRYGKFLVITALAVFGAVVSLAQGWEWLSRWGRH